jgi:hypothetical protein
MSSSFGACQNGATCTAEIAAPASVWRLDSFGPTWPALPGGFTNEITACNVPFTSGGCHGVSYAMPLVAGAAILLLARDGTLKAKDVKSRILDNATDDDALDGVVERRNNGKGGRLLNVRASLQ